MRNTGISIYQDSEFWNRDFSKISGEEERMLEVKNSIQEDVKTILDVGCGNGFFINSLSGDVSCYIKTVGLYLSFEAVRLVSGNKVQGDVARMPFKEAIFDLITCLEVLEHIPENDFKNAISEIKTASRKYILVTVPNNEYLSRSLIQCPKCLYKFNAYGHLRVLQNQC